jgi:hypothetical protein
LSGKTSLKKLLINLLGFLSIVRYIYLNQVSRRKKLPVDARYVFPISDSASFLKTVLPVIRGLLDHGLEPFILCPANHYKKLTNSLAPDIAERLIVFEQVDTGRSLLSIHFAMLGSFLASIWDMLWLLFQPIQKKAVSATGFGRYALTSRYFGKYWHNFFQEKNRMLIGANDYWFWESLLFTAAEPNSSESVVIQHGKLSDLYYPLFAKRFFAWGQADRDMMINEFDARPEEIVVTGSSYFDTVYHKFDHLAENDSAQKDWIVFLSQPFHSHTSFAKRHYDHAVEWFYGLTSIAHGKELLLKMHPFDKAAFYSDRPASVQITEADIVTTMQRATIVLFLDSTASYEAAMAGVVSVQCLEESATAFNDQSETGLAIRVKSMKELQDVVAMLLNDTAFYREALSKSRAALDYYFANLGHANEAIIRQLL